MNLQDWLQYKRQNLRRRLGRTNIARTAPFLMDQGKRPQDYGDRALSDFARMYFAHQGRPVTKWVDYLDLYDRHLSRFRNTSVRILEIGVLNGGSLELWREYFGRQATVFGIDIDPDCVNRVDAPNEVRVGSQDDPAFLQKTVRDMGGVDIVLDDGSHNARHQRASLEALFPLLENGGIYAIEDLHTSYWPGDWEGGYKRSGTGIETIKQLLDDMHAWFHDKGECLIPKTALSGIHAYESLVFIEKGQKQRPVALEPPL